jgi:hypothetical protein
MVIKNTGTLNNDIYKNTFESLHIGAQSEGANAIQITSSNYPGATTFSMSGLNYTCNKFVQDIDLADMTIVNGRIDFFQGHAIGHPSLSAATLGSARNFFSLDGESMALEHDIKVSGTAPQELQYVGLASPNYFADSYSPNWVLPLTSSYIGTYATATSSMCPSKLCLKDHEVMIAKRTEFVDLYNDLNQELQGLDPRDLASRERVLDQMNAAKSEIDLLSQQIVSFLLIEKEDLSEIRTGLLEIGERDLLAALEQLLAEDASQAPQTPDALDADEFLPISSGTPPRKMQAPIAVPALQFSISPNPSRGEIELNFDSASDATVELTVIDLMGKTVFQANAEMQNASKLDLKALNNGVYFVLVKSEGRLLGSKKIEILK